MRKLDPSTQAFITERILKNNASPSNFKPHELVALAGIALTGIGEQGGDNRGYWVDRFLSTIGLAPGNPWCMALIQTLVSYAEKISSTKSLLAEGGHVLTIFNESQNIMLPSPAIAQLGDLICFQHGDTLQGHVEVIVHNFGGFLFSTVGGNTSSGIGVNREGDGVYSQIRPATGKVGQMRVKGILRPFPLV